MLLDLSGVLSEQHTAVDETVPCSLEEFRSGAGVFPILSKEDLHIQVEHVEGERYRICCRGRLVIQIPCDRCLTPVPTEFLLDFERKVRIGASAGEEQADDFEEAEDIDGYLLDADSLVYGEILTRWPTKILCRDDCRGLCSICGRNLNLGSCDCADTGLDPRMSVIRDVFKNFKEV